MNYKVNSRGILERLENTLLYKTAGKISKSLGLIYEAHLPGASIGSLCRILNSSDMNSTEGVDTEVIGFRDKKVILMPFSDPVGVNNDSLVLLWEKQARVPVSDELLGRVIDARGNAIDGKGPLFQDEKNIEWRGLYQTPPDPLSREVIKEPLDLGVRAINGLLTIGKGQRVGIMAGSGVGKSVLLGMMARNTSADVNVVALIGERGREVREFIERDLGPEGLKNTIVVVATSDKSALQRVRAANLAFSIAEHFRDKGKDVLFLMDSVTRFCMGQREIGLSMGEPPASRGYTPSVFSILPKLLERAGTANGPGSITGLFTVLTEGDDMDDPIADAVRSIVDGHIILSRKIAQQNHFPAIDILQSTSRVMRSVIDEQQSNMASQIKEWMALYAQVEDLINIGAYAKGSNARVDQAVAVHDKIKTFLRQKIEDSGDYQSTLAAMIGIIRTGEAIAMANDPANQARPTRQNTPTQAVRF